MALPDPTQVSGPVGARLAIPTPEDPLDGQATHPAVVYAPDMPGGYPYWMGMTPYPGSDDALEDPCVVASHDGINWVVPDGLTNPIDDQPGSPGAYNSDTDLRYYDGTLHLFWRTYDAAATGAEEKLYWSSSIDGRVWSVKALIYSSDQTIRRLLSPCFVFENDAWVMWAVDIVPQPGQVVRVQGGAQPTDAWSDPDNVDLGTFPEDREPWHLGITPVEDGYVGLVNDKPISGSAGDLLMIVSADGVTWTNSGQTVIPREQPGEHTALYRAVLLPDTDGTVEGWRVWYSANRNEGSGQIWHIYRTFISLPEPPPPPLPTAPGAIAIPVIRQSVTWLGVDQTTGRIIAELPDITGEPQRQLSAYANAQMNIPLSQSIPIEQVLACTDGRSSALVCVVNDVPMWMGLPSDRRRGSGRDMVVQTYTPEGYLLKRRDRDHSFVDEDRATVAYHLALYAESLNGAWQGLGFEYDIELTGEPISIDYKATDRTTVYDAIRALCEQGLEFEVAFDWADGSQTTVTKILRIKRRIGRVTGTPAAMFETDAGSALDYDEVNSWQSSVYANFVTAIAPGQGDSQPASAPAIDTDALDSGVPVVEMVIEPGNNITDEELLNAHAAATLQAVKDGSTVIEVTGVLNGYPRLGVDCLLGDMVSYRLNGPGHPEGFELVGERRMTGWSANPQTGKWTPKLVEDPTLTAELAALSALEVS